MVATPQPSKPISTSFSSTGRRTKSRYVVHSIVTSSVCTPMARKFCCTAAAIERVLLVTARRVVNDVSFG